MAISILNSQGTQVWVLEADSGVKTATEIQLGALVGCPQSIGNIEETRTATEYKCLSSNESAKAVGSISRGTIEIGLLLDIDDATGQAALKSAFASALTCVIGIELPDTGGTSGTIFYFDALVSAVSIGIEQDAAITYTVTAEIASEISELAATP